MPRPVVAIPLVLLLAAAAPPAVGAEVRSSGPVTVTALAVEETAQGFVGVHATVQATALAGGTGRVYVATKPLAQADMQGSARLAAQVAAATLGMDWRQQDYLVSFTSDSPVIGGPSAGAVMALGLAAALHNLADPGNPWTLDPRVAATGTINPDGTIGPVGGVPAKAEGAKAAGITTFLFPAGLEKATTLTAGDFGPRQVLVDMAQHCAGLGITCRPAARLEELVSAAAHVDLTPVEVPVPSTLDYASFLDPSVRASLGTLDARVEALRADPSYQSLRGGDRTTIQAQVQEAADRSDAAERALSSQHYYQAATEAFQGAMAVGRAENLTRFVAAARAETVVLDALRRCEAAVDAVEGVAGAKASDYNALYAIGAAQQRLGNARALLDQARTAAAGRTVSQWVASLEASVFCAERAGTVSWWAGLRGEFQAGPALPDPAATAQQAIDDADDLVTYAQAVLASSGSSPRLQEAQSRLDGAREAMEDGLHPAAAVLAVEAASLASVAMQAAAGDTVPPAVLSAAQQGAARAIVSARARGIEPLSSVALVELAQAQQDPADALHSYWTARSLALLDLVAPEPVPGSPAQGTPRPAPPVGGYGNDALTASWAMGLALGLGAAGLMVVAFIGRRQ